jgi:hypothetical protein
MNNYSQPESHTHLQFAQSNAATKNCKRVCLALALTDRKTKHMGIINRTLSGLQDPAMSPC